MATDYQDVYDALLTRVRRDEDWDKLQDDDIYTDILEIMNSAIPLFLYPREDLRTRNDNTQQFTADLQEDTINVLAEFMYAQWIRRKVADTTTITQMFHSKDVQQYSQANHLAATKELAKDALKEARRMAADYQKIDANGSSVLDSGLVGET